MYGLIEISKNGKYLSMDENNKIKYGTESLFSLFLIFKNIK